MGFYESTYCAEIPQQVLNKQWGALNSMNPLISIIYELMDFAFKL